MSNVFGTGGASTRERWKSILVSGALDTRLIHPVKRDEGGVGAGAGGCSGIGAEGWLCGDHLYASAELGDGCVLALIADAVCKLSDASDELALMLLITGDLPVGAGEDHAAASLGLFRGLAKLMSFMLGTLVKSRVPDASFWGDILGRSGIGGTAGGEKWRCIAYASARKLLELFFRSGVVPRSCRRGLPASAAVAAMCVTNTSHSSCVFPHVICHVFPR